MFIVQQEQSMTFFKYRKFRTISRNFFSHAFIHGLYNDTIYVVILYFFLNTWKCTGCGL